MISSRARLTSMSLLFYQDLYFTFSCSLQAQDAEYARAVQSGIRPCPVCRNNIHPDFIFRTKFFEPTEVELNVLRESHPNASSSSGGVTPVDVKGKGKAVDELAELDDILADMHNETFEPSAKMIRMVDLLKQCMAICFFLSYEDIVDC